LADSILYITTSAAAVAIHSYLVIAHKSKSIEKIAVVSLVKTSENKPD
jgi:hypothetical protein